MIDTRVKAETCKNCHGYWVHPDDSHAPFCSTDCQSHWGSWENNRKSEIYRKIDYFQKQIDELKKQL